MGNIICPKRRSADTTAPAVAALADGEMAVNTVSRRIYVRVGATVVEVGNFVDLPGYISGLQLIWNSTSSLSVTSGAAYIEGGGDILHVTGTITLSGLSLAGSTWYSLYLYNNGGTPAIELVTTAPAAPYSGNARSKTADSSRRFLGMLRTGGSGALLPFVHTSDDFLYPAAGTFAPYRVLANGTASSPTTVDMSGSVPTVAKAAHLRVFNQNNVNISLIATGFGTVSSSVYSMRVNAGLIFGAPLPLGDTKSFDYTLDSTGSGGLYVDVVGYRMER